MNKVKLKQAMRRRELIEAAIPIINSNEFEDISVADICKGTGISVGTFYHYFTSKNDLLAGLLGLIDIHIAENVSPKLNSEDETLNLLTFALGWAEHVAANGIERSRLISTIEPKDIDAFGQKRESVLILENIIAKGIEKGQITNEFSCEKLAEMFLLALRAVTVDWSRNNGSYDISKKMEEFIKVFLKGIRACEKT